MESVLLKIWVQYFTYQLTPPWAKVTFSGYGPLFLFKRSFGLKVLSLQSSFSFFNEKLEIKIFHAISDERRWLKKG
jgi:hypothetical protein